MKRTLTLPQTLPYILLLAGSVGFACAFIIMLEKLHLQSDPAYVPSCSLNPIISCGSVMTSKQAAAFGFPNPLIGLAAFPVVAAIGAAMLAGATFKRWFWWGVEAGVLFGAGFIHWLFFQSVYRIGALCPYCMAVWLVTFIIFWYVTLYVVREGHLKAPAALQGITRWAQRHHGDVLLGWVLCIVGLILYRFWYYWSTLL